MNSVFALFDLVIKYEMIAIKNNDIPSIKYLGVEIKIRICSFICNF